MVVIIILPHRSRPDRLKEIATRFGLDPDEALDNVIYARAFNTEHQMDLITLLAAKFSERPGEYRLLVVDSIISLFRTDYSGRGELGERQQRLNQMMRFWNENIKGRGAAYLASIGQQP